VARLIDLLIPGRQGEALEAARQESERRLAELREQSRRLRRVIQKLHDEDRRRERS
jgi:hypothetical protein